MFSTRRRAQHVTFTWEEKTLEEADSRALTCGDEGMITGEKVAKKMIVCM